MNDKIQSVDVEAIMAEIQERIKEREYSPEMLSFDEVTVGMELQDGVSGDNVMYSDAELSQSIKLASAAHNISYYEPMAGNKIKVFIKRVLRKLMAFQMLPLRDRQNQFNYQILQSVRLLDARVNELEDALLRKEALIEELEARIQTLDNK